MGSKIPSLDVGVVTTDAVNADEYYKSGALISGGKWFRVPVLGYKVPGAFQGFSYGVPVDTETGEDASSIITIDKTTSAGNDIVISSRFVKQLFFKICSTYGNNTGTRLEYLALVVGATITENCATGIPDGSNNFRIDNSVFWAGVEAGAEMQFVVIENSPATSTFGNATLLLELKE